MEALGRMLQTGHFSRGGGSEQIGSAERLEDWTPKINGDIWNFLTGRITAWQRLRPVTTRLRRKHKQCLAHTFVACLILCRLTMFVQ